MRGRQSVAAACLAAGFVLALEAAQGPGPARGAGAGSAGAGGKLIGGTLTPAVPDARGWGWQVKASVNPA